MAVSNFRFSEVIVLLLSARLHVARAFDGCGFCREGFLSNPEALIALRSPDQTHSCIEWQRNDSLTETFTDEACNFIGPFYEAICGCNLSRIHDQCDVCGSPELVFANPLKALVIPNSDNQHILCRTIYSGVQMGAVPPGDCQVLKGITDFCGGCIGSTAEATETTDAIAVPTGEPSDSIVSDVFSPSQAPSLETFVAITVAPSPTPTRTSTASPTAVPITLTPSASPSASPTASPTTNPTARPTATPTGSPTVTLSASPTISPTASPTESPTASPTESPTTSPTDIPTVAPTKSPTSSPSGKPSGSFYPSSPPTNIPTDSVSPSSSPTGTPSSSPTIHPTSEPSFSPTNQPSTNPTITFSSQPSSQPTMQPSTDPTTTPSSFPSSMTSTQPSIAPTATPSLSKIDDQPTMEKFVSLSSATCDLCPPTGTLDRPKKLISLVNMENQTVTKTCGALLWDTRAGRNNIDESACLFLRPFFGAICGCSTFNPSVHETSSNEKDRRNGKKDCKMCENPSHEFQNPNKSLPIPGSRTTQITCGGIFSGAMSGAVTSNECETLMNIAESCGGCGEQKKNSSVESSPQDQCFDCLDENESPMYIYKDFGSSGTTFQKAVSAPLHCDDGNRNRQSNRNCTKLLYPELTGCILAPITSFDELLRVQSVIPTGKAAYTAVQKDRLLYKVEAEECYDNNNDHDSIVDVELSRSGDSTSISNKQCKVENWMEGLTFGSKKIRYEGKQKFDILASQAAGPCESLKSGWKNYNTGTTVPSSLWGNGQPSFCNLGHVQNVGAVWGVEAEGQNYGDLRDVSTNWPLPGAVYKCCRTLHNCFEGVN